MTPSPPDDPDAGDDRDSLPERSDENPRSWYARRNTRNAAIKNGYARTKKRSATEGNGVALANELVRGQAHLAPSVANSPAESSAHAGREGLPASSRSRHAKEKSAPASRHPSFTDRGDPEQHPGCEGLSEEGRVGKSPPRDVDGRRASNTTRRRRARTGLALTARLRCESRADFGEHGGGLVPAQEDVEAGAEPREQPSTSEAELPPRDRVSGNAPRPPNGPWCLRHRAPWP